MKKRETLRDRFGDNYIAVRVADNSAKGYRTKYIYYAPWYYWDLPQNKLRKEKALICICSILSLLAFVFTAAQRTELNTMAAVYVPCALALCAHILELVGMGQFCLAKQPTTKMTYQDVDRMMEFAPAARAICTAAAGCVSFFSGIAGKEMAWSLGIAAGYLACAALACYEIFRYDRIPRRTEKNPALDEMEFSEEKADA